MSGDLDMPFEANPPGQTFDMSDALVSGGVVIMAPAAPLKAGGSIPALVYRFSKPDGSGFYPPIMLVVDGDGMEKIAGLTRRAASAATAAAS